MKIFSKNYVPFSKVPFIFFILGPIFLISCKQDEIGITRAERVDVCTPRFHVLYGKVQKPDEYSKFSKIEPSDNPSDEFKNLKLDFSSKDFESHSKKSETKKNSDEMIKKAQVVQVQVDDEISSAPKTAEISKNSSEEELADIFSNIHAIDNHHQSIQKEIEEILKVKVCLHEVTREKIIPEQNRKLIIAQEKSQAILDLLSPLKAYVDQREKLDQKLGIRFVDSEGKDEFYIPLSPSDYVNNAHYCEFVGHVDSSNKKDKLESNLENKEDEKNQKDTLETIKPSYLSPQFTVGQIFEAFTEFEKSFYVDENEMDHNEFFEKIFLQWPTCPIKKDLEKIKILKYKMGFLNPELSFRHFLNTKN